MTLKEAENLGAPERMMAAPTEALATIADAASETLKIDPVFIATWNAAVDAHTRTQSIIDLVESRMELQYGLSNIGERETFTAAEVLELNGEILEVWGVGKKYEGVPCDSLQDMWTANKTGGYHILFGKGARLLRFENLTAQEYRQLTTQRKLAEDGSIDCTEILLFYPDFVPRATSTDNSPKVGFEDPAAVNVGYGVPEPAYTTIASGVAAVDADGTVTVWPQNAAGNRTYYNEQIDLYKSVTIQSETVGLKYFVQGASNGVIRPWTGSEGSVVSDLVAINGGIAFYSIGSNITYNRCVATNSSGTSNGFQCQSSGVMTSNNCVSIGYAVGWYSSSGSVTCNYCATYSCTIAGFGCNSTMVVNNSVGYNKWASYGDFWQQGGSLTGNNNASSDTTATGATHYYNITPAGCAFIYTKTYARSLENTWLGIYFLDSDGGTLVDAGDATLCPAVTTDIDGRARSATTSNIGPVEGFTGFAAATPTAAAPTPGAITDLYAGRGTVAFTGGESGGTVEMRLIASPYTVVGGGTVASGLVIFRIVVGANTNAYELICKKTAYNDSTAAACGAQVMAAGLANADVLDSAANGNVATGQAGTAIASSRVPLFTLMLNQPYGANWNTQIRLGGTEDWSRAWIRVPGGTTGTNVLAKIYNYRLGSGVGAEILTLLNNVSIDFTTGYVSLKDMGAAPWTPAAAVDAILIVTLSGGTPSIPGTSIVGYLLCPVTPCETAPGKATSVSAAGTDRAIDLTGTLPADPSGGTCDRFGVAISLTSAADAASKAAAGTFSAIFTGLTALAAYTRRLSELSGGVDLVNGTPYWLVMVPGNNAGYFNVGAVAGDAVTATPGVGTAPGKATGISAAGAWQRIEVNLTTPASPSGGVTDRIAFAISATSAADALALALAGTFGGVKDGLAPSTEYAGLTIAELSDGTNLVNDEPVWYVPCPGARDPLTGAVAYCAAFVFGDVQTATPVGDTPPSTPALTLGTVSGLDIPVSVSGQTGVTNVVKLYRRSTGALVDTETRIGNGVVTLVAPVRPAIYDIVAYSMADSLNSVPVLLSSGVWVEDATPRRGAMNALLVNLQTLIASSDSYQTLVGAADAEAAKASIFRSRAPGTQARPFSVVSLGNEWEETRIARGAAGTYAERGQLYWLLEADIAAGDQDDPEAALDEFRAVLDDVKSDMETLAGTEAGGVVLMDLNSIGIESGIFQSAKSDEAQGRYFIQAFMRVHYGSG